MNSRTLRMWLRPGMQIMIFWSAAIAWRRFLQGAMIHFGHTRPIGWGTAVRLLARRLLDHVWRETLDGGTMLVRGQRTEVLTTYIEC